MISYRSVKKPKLLFLIAAMFCCLTLNVYAGSAGIARQLSNEIADTVEKVMPTVVVVRTEAIQYQLARDYYWGDIYKIPQRLAGQGSGIIFDKRGYILTSAHVVSGADNIEIVLDNEEKYQASLAGTDPNTDLAVLKITPRSTLRAIDIGDSDKSRIGELVIALGSPFSLQSSVTMGIISQKGRHIGLLPYEDFIQTDASINPGNSGGPLVNIDGKLIGVNAVIQTPNPQIHGNIGIGFAVPANLAIRVARSIIENGSFERPWIGISTAPPFPGGGQNQGVVVGNVYRNTPAADVALRRNDTILKIDGKPVSNISALQKAIMLRKPGKEITLTIKRAGKTVSVQLTPVPMPNTHQILRSDQNIP